MIRVLPQHFYENPDVRVLLADGHSCILHKKLTMPVVGKEGYVSTHAITMVLRGKLHVENEDGLFTEVPEGNMILLPKGIYTVTDIFPKNDAFEAMMFFFEKEVLDRFIQSLNLPHKQRHGVSHLVLKTTETLRFFSNTLLKLYGNAEQMPRELTQMKLFELLHLLQSGQTSDHFLDALATLNNRERRSLREFMNANYTKPLSIEDYAYLTGRSISSFRRDFKAQFGGISPKQWLIDRRLERAETLLTEKQLPVGQVVLEIGYDNIPHFTKAFRERYGLPPKQFLIQKRKEALV